MPQENIIKTNIDITYLRSTETMIKYILFNQKIQNGELKLSFDEQFKKPIKEFNHWIIIKNKFPYDAIAEKNHLLFTKRKVEFDWEKLNEEEKLEYRKIRNGYLSQNYDAIQENLPSGQTVPGHFHLQLLTFKRKKINLDF